MGALIDHVRVDAGCETLMRALIGDVLLVESLEADYLIHLLANKDQVSYAKANL